MKSKILAAGLFVALILISASSDAIDQYATALGPDTFIVTSNSRDTLSQFVQLFKVVDGKMKMLDAIYIQAEWASWENKEGLRYSVVRAKSISESESAPRNGSKPSSQDLKIGPQW